MPHTLKRALGVSRRTKECTNIIRECIRDPEEGRDLVPEFNFPPNNKPQCFEGEEVSLEGVGEEVIGVPPEEGALEWNFGEEEEE